MESEYRPETEYDEAPAMDDQELWEKACQKAGVWKCNTSLGLCITKNHLHLCPTNGDEEATVKLLEWLGHNDPMSLGFKIHYWPERDEQLPWNVTFSGQASNEGRTLPLALAAAVLGVPDGK